MNITSMEMTQALVEIIGALLCIVTIILIVSHGTTRTVKLINNLLWIGVVLLCTDAGAYIFRGNIDTVSVIMTRICNYTNFFSNVAITYGSVKLAYSLVEELDVVVPSKVYFRIVEIMCAVSTLMIIINIPTGWIFGFDSQNYYHRNFGWYVFAAFLIISTSVVILFAFVYRKNIGRRVFTSIVIYEAAPGLMGVLQALFYGISLATFGVGLGLIVVLFSYYTSEKSLSDKGKQHNVRRLAIFMITLFVVLGTMGASIISCVYSFDNLAEEKVQQDRELLTHMVKSSIEKELLRPITVSLAIAKNNDIIELLDSEQALVPEAIEDQVAECLALLREAFDYRVVFVASDKTGIYYTYDGISKYFDFENDEHDVWYSDFIKSGAIYSLNVDTDEMHNKELAVFINTKMTNAEGQIIGVCGVGVEMTRLQELIRNDEQLYNVEIKLVNKDGLVQVSSDSADVETLALDNEYFGDMLGEDTLYYGVDDGHNTQTVYLPDLDWYLIVKDMESGSTNYINIFPSVGIFIIGMLLTLLLYWVLIVRNNNTDRELRENVLISRTDQLTGLLNRRAYEQDIMSMSEYADDLGIVMIDVNGLKTVNDTIGHEAGDELLEGAAACIQKVFSTYGAVYRTGGDEFVALIKCSHEELKDSVKRLDSDTDGWRGPNVHELSLSKGVVRWSDNKELSFKELVKKADKLMYEDKNEYYRRTGRNRRMTW